MVSNSPVILGSRHTRVSRHAHPPDSNTHACNMNCAVTRRNANVKCRNTVCSAIILLWRLGWKLLKFSCAQYIKKKYHDTQNKHTSLMIVFQRGTLSGTFTVHWDVVIIAYKCSESGCVSTVICSKREWSNQVNKGSGYSDLCTSVCPVHICNVISMNMFRKTDVYCRHSPKGCSAEALWLLISVL